MAEALSMAEDAASGWVLIELEDGSPVPRASLIQDVEAEAGQFVRLIELDMGYITK